MARKALPPRETGFGGSGARPPRAFSTQSELATTGAWLVTFRKGAANEGLEMLASATGIRSLPHSSDFKHSDMASAALGEEGGMVLEHLGVAVVHTPPENMNVMSAALDGEGPILAIEPEPLMSTSARSVGAPIDPEYFQGYLDGVRNVISSTLGALPSSEPRVESIGFQDTPQATWGLDATGVLRCSRYGRGVKVAVLDTGIDLTHPDFSGRPITKASFVGGSVQDGHGHGTHCAGVVAGPLRPPSGQRRYGCAPLVDLYIGKVLADSGFAAPGSVPTGIEWAISQGCRIVSMSFSSPVRPGDKPLIAYEAIGQRALNQGTLLVTAAGNESRRPGMIAPVGSPANARSFLAVAALDNTLSVASFSCGGINDDGGAVDLAAPGVGVFSSYRGSEYFRSLNGTSMAAPYVAGIAALWSEAREQSGRVDLWQVLISNARHLPLLNTDIGGGLVQAPAC